MLCKLDPYVPEIILDYLGILTMFTESVDPKVKYKYVYMAARYAFMQYVDGMGTSIPYYLPS